MCVGGKFFKKILPIAAMAVAAYFAGPALFGAAGAAGGAAAGGAAAGGAAAGAAASSAAAIPFYGASAGLGSSLAGSALAGGLSSVAPAALAAGSSAAFLPSVATGFGGLLSSGLNFVKDNSFLLGQASNAAGIYGKYVANNQMQEDFSKSIENNRLRNDALQRQADGINADTLGNFSLDNQNLQLDKAYIERLAGIQAAQIPSDSVYLPSANSAPQDVKSDLARIISNSLADGRTRQAAGARLNAYGDLDIGNSLTLNESARKINQLGNFSQGNNNTLNAELAFAQTKPRTAGTFGDALQGIGSIANAYAVTRPRVS